MAGQQDLSTLINQTPFLSMGDKSFLLEKLPLLSPLEKFKLQSSLLAGEAPPILQSLQILRAKFYEKETPAKPDLISKITNIFNPQKPKKVVATSILTQPNILGSNPLQPMRADNIRPLKTLEDFYHPAQLGMLNTAHITFNINASTEQTLQNFLQNLTKIFEPIQDINQKRSYFMNFVQSQLFSSYINTGLTATRHTELEPRKVVLNLLYQINSNYLNNKQFQLASIICNHLRHLCGL